MFLNSLIDFLKSHGDYREVILSPRSANDDENRREEEKTAAKECL